MPNTAGPRHTILNLDPGQWYSNEAAAPGNQPQALGSERQVRQLLEKRVILVTGKGGVGRTTLTGALALRAAQMGKKVLVSEISGPTQGYSALARVFNENSLAVKPSQLRPSIEGCLLWSREGQGRFLSTVLPKAIPVRRVLGSKALSSLLDAAPSLNEMGVFYHMLDLLKQTNEAESPEWDLLLIDMPATGHALAMTSLPDVLLNVLPDGRISDILREGQDFMSDPRRSAAVVVTLPETLPVTECLELVEGLQATSVTVGGVLVNRVPTDPFTPSEKAALGPILTHPELFGVPTVARTRGSERALNRLRRATSVPIWTTPELDLDSEGWLEDLAAGFKAYGGSHG